MSFVGLKWWVILTKQARGEFLFGVKIEPFSFHNTHHHHHQQAASKQASKHKEAAKASKYK
jgi:hypothetical protein